MVSVTPTPEPGLRAAPAELCLRCGAVMEWRHQTWQCPRCGLKLGCCEGETADCATHAA